MVVATTKGWGAAAGAALPRPRPAAVRQPQLAAPERSPLERQLGPCERLRLAGDDVDGGEQGVAAVQRRARAVYDLDPLHQVHVDALILAGAGVVPDVVVHRVAVDLDLPPGVVVAGAGKAAHADIGVIAVIVDVEAGNGLQHLAQRAEAVTGDLLG